MHTLSSPGLYVHVPFCRTKCPYCDFYSCTDMSGVREFTAAMTRELGCYAADFPFVDSVYFGGGTPTALPDEPLALLMKAIADRIVVSPDAEITIEANPNDLPPRRLALFRALGFNRLSLGVQSFDDRVLEFLGRRHTAGEARQAIVQARQEGFENISLDFMYAIPGQGRAAWLVTLEEALSFSPEHLSCYQLTIKEGTPFSGCVRSGELEPCSDEEQAELFLATSGFLEKSGYRHYEVSNFCRSDDLQARHNRKYWEHAPYLGLGPSAHSFDGRRRWWNAPSAGDYVRALNCAAPALPVDGSEELTGEQLRDESMLLGLRTRQGAALDTVPACPATRRMLAELEAGGLVEVSGGRVRPTARGMLVADSIAAALLGAPPRRLHCD